MISGIIMGLTVFIFPWLSYLVAKKYRNRLDEPEVKARIGNLTLVIHLYRHPRAIFYHAVFLGRRLLFVIVPTMFVNIPIF